MCRFRGKGARRLGRSRSCRWRNGECRRRRGHRVATRGQKTAPRRRPRSSAGEIRRDARPQGTRWRPPAAWRRRHREAVPVQTRDRPTRDRVQRRRRCRGRDPSWRPVCGMPPIRTLTSSQRLKKSRKQERERGIAASQRTTLRVESQEGGQASCLSSSSRTNSVPRFTQSCLRQGHQQRRYIARSCLQTMRNPAVASLSYTAEQNQNSRAQNTLTRAANHFFV